MEGKAFCQTSHLDNLLKQNCFHQVIEYCKSIIQANPYCIHPIDGLGNADDDKKQHGINLINWFLQSKQNQQVLGTVFDTLFIVNSIVEDYVNQIIWFQKMIEKYPKCYQLHFGLGNLYYRQRECQRAENQYKICIQIYPQFYKAYQLIGNIYFYIYNEEKQIILNWVTKSLAIRQHNFYAEYMFAYIKQSNQERMKCLKELVDKYPKQCRGYNGIANIYFIRSDNDTAIEYYNKSISVNRFYNVAYYNIANIYKAQKKTEQAKQMYKKCIEMNRFYDNAYYNLANIYEEQKNHIEAASTFRICVQLCPKDPLYLTSYAVSLQASNGDEEEIMNAYEKAKFYMQKVENIYLIQNNKHWINRCIREFYGEGENFNNRRRFGLGSKRQRCIRSKMKKEFESKFRTLFK